MTDDKPVRLPPVHSLDDDEAAYWAEVMSERHRQMLAQRAAMRAARPPAERVDEPHLPATKALRHSAARLLEHIVVYTLPALRDSGRASGRQHAVDLERLAVELHEALDRHRREGEG